MKQDNPYNLHAQTTENEEECLQMLFLAKLHHPEAVVINATLGDRGQTVFTTYVQPGETPLKIRANDALKAEGTRQFILNSPGAKGICVLSSEKFPWWVKRFGTRIPIVRDAED